MANYNYKPEALKPLKKQRLLTNIAIFDIETDEWLPDTYRVPKEKIMEWHDRPLNPFLAGTLIDNKITIYEGKNCIKDFLNDYLIEENRGRICYAHNGGKFDFIALFEILRRDKHLERKFLMKTHMAHSRIITFKVKRRNSNRVWFFRDSFALLPDSLADLCDSFKPVHLKLERPHDKYKGNEKEWQNYFKNDLLSLNEILVMFNQVIKDVGGSIGNTIASTAMATFRKKFLHQDLPTYYEWNDFIRKGYYGGRVEVFNMYAIDCGKPYYYYDCNSEFPAVMHDNIFPVSKPIRVDYADADECFGKCGVMECLVTTPKHLNIPILPYRTLEKKLIFPLGTWKGTYEFSLIEKAVMNGYEIKPLRTIEFEGEPLFKPYVDAFYTLKRQSEGAFQRTMKFLLNCLYGKWGERQDREELITDPDEDITGAFPLDDEFGYCIRKFQRFSAYHQPATASRVTSLAQLKLYSMFEEIQRRNGTIYYCDTDSVITDVRIPTSKELGEWKLEHEIIEAVFLAPKTYCLHTYDKDDPYKIVMKGFSNKMREHLSFQDFEDALPPNNNFSKFSEYRIAPASIKQIGTRHLHGFVTQVMPRSISHIYDKREIEDGLTTCPLQVEEGIVNWTTDPFIEVYDESDL
jgi:hypothetical protein